MLDYLCGKAAVRLYPSLKSTVLIFHLYAFISLYRSHPLKRKASLLGRISAVPLYDLGIIHYLVLTLVIKGDYCNRLAYHICRHTHASLTVCLQCLQKVLGYPLILKGRRSRPSLQKQYISAYLPYHKNPLSAFSG